MIKKLTTEGRFECGFDAATHGKLCALVAVIQPRGMGLGIAVANEPGYIPVPLSWCNGDNWQELTAHAAELNTELFGHTPRVMVEIAVSSSGCSAPPPPH